MANTKKKRDEAFVYSNEAFETATMLSKHSAANVVLHGGQLSLEDVQRAYEEGCKERGLVPDPECMRPRSERKAGGEDVD